MWLYLIARINWITEAWDEFSKVCNRLLADSNYVNMFENYEIHMAKEFHKS